MNKRLKDIYTILDTRCQEFTSDKLLKIGSYAAIALLAHGVMFIYLCMRKVWF